MTINKGYAELALGSESVCVLGGGGIWKMLGDLLILKDF